jgi:hypothetical protein
MRRTLDHEGRNVILSDERRRHIRRGHPELRVRADVILDTVTNPDAHLVGDEPGASGSTGGVSARVAGSGWSYTTKVTTAW